MKFLIVSNVPNHNTGSLVTYYISVNYLDFSPLQTCWNWINSPQSQCPCQPFPSSVFRTFIQLSPGWEVMGFWVCWQKVPFIIKLWRLSSSFNKLNIKNAGHRLKSCPLLTGGISQRIIFKLSKRRLTLNSPLYLIFQHRWVSPPLLEHIHHTLPRFLFIHLLVKTWFPSYINESFSSKESLKLLLIQGQMSLIVSSDREVVDFLDFLSPYTGMNCDNSEGEDDIKLYLVFIGLELICRNVS